MHHIEYTLKALSKKMNLFETDAFLFFMKNDPPSMSEFRQPGCFARILPVRFGLLHKSFP